MSAIPLEITRHKVARGHVEKNGRLQIAIRMDEDVFEGVHALAQARNISFASQVRILLQDGLNRAAGAREVAA